MATETKKIQLRRDTAANFTASNPTLSAGELAFETDTGKFKIGTGANAWSSLPYAALLPSELASVAEGLGAGLIAVADAAGKFVGGTVEAVLAELQDNIDGLLNYTNTTFIPLGGIPDRVRYVDFGGDASAARPTGVTQLSIGNWFQNGFDKPVNANPVDKYNLPAGLLDFQNESVSRDLSDSDRGKILHGSSGTLTFTIRDDVTAGWSYGAALKTSIGYINKTGNAMTITAAVGVTLDGVDNGSVTIPDGGSGLAWRDGADAWLYHGDTA